MAKKNQHIVSKFHLKKFSIDNKNTHIGIYNKPSKNYIAKGALDDQGYKKYFYGKDEVLENELSKIENECSKAFADLIKREELPKHNSKDAFLLRFFTFLQDSKTAEKVDSQKEFFYKTTQKIIKLIDKDEDRFDNITFGYENPAGASIDHILNNFNLIVDLESKLIINKSKLPFIFSDNPTVRYNQLMEKFDKPGCHTGLTTKGLQIFIPISPKLMLCYYDQRVYKIGSRKQRNISIVSEEDINQLNSLQYLNSDKNLYFNQQLVEEYFIELDKKNQKYDLEPDKIGMNESKRIKNSDGTTSVFLHTYDKDKFCNLKLSFIGYTKKGNLFKPTEWAIELRNGKKRFSGSI